MIGQRQASLRDVMSSERASQASFPRAIVLRLVSLRLMRPCVQDQRAGAERR
jgi:hypothetical protein